MKQLTAACGILFQNCERVLLVKRLYQPAQGLWALPGGKQELGETLEETIEREMREECNVEIETKGPLVCTTRVPPDFVLHHFLVELKSSKSIALKARSDAKQIKWVPIQDVLNDKAYKEHVKDLDFVLQQALLRLH